MMSNYDQCYFLNQLNRSYLRKLIRSFYLRNIAVQCIGKTIDLGCGTGELLKLLPKGSLGLEINPFAVEYCKKKGLQVCLLPEVWKMHHVYMAMDKPFETIVLNHVLEHFQEPEKLLDLLIQEQTIMGLRRLIIVVPGKKGFLSDETHSTFIDKKWFKLFFNEDQRGIRIKKVSFKYFPWNNERLGNIFTHHELHAILDFV